MNAQQTPPIPITILCGFLGSGKTTLLNRILSGNSGLKTAVIVNEFGEIGIDNQFIESMDEMNGVVELNNGCICCTINADLLDTVRRLLDMKDGKIDYILIETTGLADPQPVAQTLWVPEIAEKAVIDSIVTMVDAVNLPQAMEETFIAEAQIAFADFIVLNKVQRREDESRSAHRKTDSRPEPVCAHLEDELRRHRPEPDFRRRRLSAGGTDRRRCA